MGFFSGYDSTRAVLAGLGKLTRGNTNAPSGEATRVVNAFVRGEIAAGSCHGSGADKACEIVSTGTKLLVNDVPLASKKNKGTDEVKVCIPSRADFMPGPLMPGQKRKETQPSKDLRATSSALMRVIGAGIGVKTDPTGARRFTGSKGAARFMVPDVSGCFTLKLTKAQRRAASFGTYASMRATEAYNKPIPTKGEIEKMKKAIAKERKAAAAQRSKLKRAMKKYGQALVADKAFGPALPSGGMEMTWADRAALTRAGNAMRAPSPYAGGRLPPGETMYASPADAWLASQRAKAAKKKPASKRRRSKK